jgi:hypothetical protein
MLFVYIPTVKFYTYRDENALAEIPATSFQLTTQKKRRHHGVKLSESGFAGLKDLQD